MSNRIVSSLKPWVDHYNTHTYNGRTTTGSRRAEVKTSGFDWYYLPYYLLELPGHTYIVAQIPQDSAEAVRRGEHITLPVGQKVGMTDTAREHLSAIYEEYGADRTVYSMPLTTNGRQNTILFVCCFALERLPCFGLCCLSG